MLVYALFATIEQDGSARYELLEACGESSLAGILEHARSIAGNVVNPPAGTTAVTVRAVKNIRDLAAFRLAFARIERTPLTQLPGDGIWYRTYTEPAESELEYARRTAGQGVRS